MWQVQLSDSAVADLDEIYRWQAQPGAGMAAVRRLRAIGAALRRLRRAPYLYQIGERPGTREATAGGHRIVYRISPDTGSNTTAGDVLVLRVFGPGQRRDEP